MKLNARQSKAYSFVIAFSVIFHRFFQLVPSQTGHVLNCIVLPALNSGTVNVSSSGRRRLVELELIWIGMEEWKTVGSES